MVDRNADGQGFDDLKEGLARAFEAAGVRMTAWILDGRVPAEVDAATGMAWAASNPEAGRVAFDKVGDAAISTVFVGGMALPGSPSMRPDRLFETMVFGGAEDGLTRRYGSWEDAARGHAETVATLSAQDGPGR